MWNIYSNLIIACLTIGLAYLHKRLSERHVPMRASVSEEGTTDLRLVVEIKAKQNYETLAKRKAG